VVIDTKKIRKKKSPAQLLYGIYIFPFVGGRDSSSPAHVEWPSALLRVGSLFFSFFALTFLCWVYHYVLGVFGRRRSSTHNHFLYFFFKERKRKKKEKKAVLPCMDKNLSRRETSPCVHSPVDACEYVPLAPKPKEDEEEEEIL
jgi:hypothetical protein